SRTGRRYFRSVLPAVARCLFGCFSGGCGIRSAMEHSGPSEVTGADAAGPDPQLAVTMGFTGFGKKARTFDLEAMFEQTRRTAVERSRKTLEAREKEEEMNREKELRKHIEDAEPAPSSSAVREHSKPASRCLHASKGFSSLKLSFPRHS
ncbi:WD repeat-containing protein 70, partial [Lemmus lemmus]